MRLLVLAACAAALSFPAGLLAGAITIRPVPTVTVTSSGRTQEQNWQAWQDCLAAGGRSMLSPDPASPVLVCEP